MNISANFNSRPCERGFCVFSPASPSTVNFNSRPCERGFLRSNRFRDSAEFQFTPLREGLQHIELAVNISYVFQFTPLREGLQARKASPCKRIYFNSRPCERGFVFVASLIFLRLEFQFTPLREGLPSQERKSCHERKFQFTPLREGLQRRKNRNTARNRFQFTPLREGLRLFRILVQKVQNFNSRPCERGFVSSLRPVRPLSISIHAPARGASW